MVENTKSCRFAEKVCPACNRAYTKDLTVCPHDRTMLLTPLYSLDSGDDVDDWVYRSQFYDTKHCLRCHRHFHHIKADRCPDDNAHLEICVKLEKGKGPTIEDRFVLDSYIAGGRRSDVVRAFDIENENFVAVKFMLWQIYQDQKTVARFFKLAKASLTLDHPNILGVLSVNTTAKGRLYVVTKFVIGNSMHERIRELHKDPARAVEMFIALCAGLSHAHKAEVVHSNILPSNIYIASENGENLRPMLVDFGIAERMFQELEWDKPSTDTHTASVYGDPSGFSPEFCSGTRPNPQTDIYQLGCCLYEALIGHPVFEADNVMSVICKHLYDTPPDLDDKSPLPERLRNVVLKCLAKKPEDRFQTADELQNELEGCLPELCK